MINGVERALVLAPHTDDGEFGCGGTMARLVEAGTDVRYVAFSIATRRKLCLSRHWRIRFLVTSPQTGCRSAPKSAAFPVSRRVLGVAPMERACSPII